MTVDVGQMFKWWLVIQAILKSCAWALAVGKKREPLTAGDAAFRFVVSAIFIAGILLFWRCQ